MRLRLPSVRLIIYSLFFVILFIVTGSWVWDTHFLNAAVWHPQSIVFSPNKNYRDDFGVTIAVDRDTVVVGAPGFQISDASGAAYVYINSGSTWQLQAKLIGDDFLPDSGEDFGKSIDISKDTVVVLGDQVGEPSDQGSFYLFERRGSSWFQQAKLQSPPSEIQGKVHPRIIDVAIDGDTLVVGAERAAYVYRRDESTSTWIYETKLISPDSNDSQTATTKTCTFGSAVAISGDTIVVGSGDRSFGVTGNCANVFVRHSTTRQWVHQALLLPNNCQSINTCNGLSGFGYSVAIDEDTIVVGTAATLPGPFAYCDSRGSDAAYVFERMPQTGTWRQTASLRPVGIWTNFLATRCGFGEAVAVTENMVLVTGVHFRAAPHLFSRDSQTGQWQYQAKVEVAQQGVYESDRLLTSMQSVGISDHHVVISDTTLSQSEQDMNHSGAFYTLDLRNAISHGTPRRS